AEARGGRRGGRAASPARCRRDRPVQVRRSVGQRSDADVQDRDRRTTGTATGTRTAATGATATAVTAATGEAARIGSAAATVSAVAATAAGSAVATGTTGRGGHLGRVEVDGRAAGVDPEGATARGAGLDAGCTA